MADTTPLPLRSEFLCRMSLSTGAPQNVGTARNGELRIVPVTGGTVEGPKLRGEVLPELGTWLARPTQETAEALMAVGATSGAGMLAGADLALISTTDHDHPGRAA